MEFLEKLLKKLTEKVSTIFISTVLISATSLVVFNSRRCPQPILPPVLKVTPIICEFLSFEELVRSNNDLMTRFPNPLVIFLTEEINVSSLINEQAELVLDIDEFSNQTNIDDQDDQIPEHSSGSYFLGEIEFLEQIEKRRKSKKDLFVTKYIEYLNMGRVLAKIRQKLVEKQPEIHLLCEIPSPEARDMIKLLVQNVLNFYLKKVDRQDFLSWRNCIPEFNKIKQNRENIEKQLKLLDKKRIILYSNIRRFSPQEIRLIISRIETSQQKLLFQKEVEDSSFERVKGKIPFSIRDLTYKMARIAVTEMSGNEFIKRILEVLKAEALARRRLKNESLCHLIHENKNLRLKARCFEQCPTRTTSFSSMISSNVPSLTARGERIRTNPRMSRLRFEAGETSWRENTGFDPCGFQTASDNLLYLTEVSESEASEEAGSSGDTAEP